MRGMDRAGPPLYGASHITTKALIAVGADIDARDKNGQTPLHVAAEHYGGEKIKELIAAGADVNARDKNGETPLHAAASSYKRRGQAKMLIAAGADVNAWDKANNTPLHDAAGSGNAEAAKALIAAGADVNARPAGFGWTPLKEALMYSNRATNRETARILRAAGGVE